MPSNCGFFFNFSVVFMPRVFFFTVVLEPTVFPIPSALSRKKKVVLLSSFLECRRFIVRFFLFCSMLLYSVFCQNNDLPHSVQRKKVLLSLLFLYISVFLSCLWVNDELRSSFCCVCVCARCVSTVFFSLLCHPIDLYM